MATITRSQTTEEISKQLQTLTASLSEIGALTTSINTLVAKQDSQDEKLRNILETVVKSEETINAVRNDFAEYKAVTNVRLSKLEKDLTVNREHDDRMHKLEKELRTLRDETKIAKLMTEYHNKKYNLIINGIPEKKSLNENGLSVWESNIVSTDAVRNFFANVLLVDKSHRWNFVNVHRLGMPKANRPRGIIVRFSDMRNKDIVMENLFRLKNYNQIEDGARIYVQEHLPVRMGKQRKMLVPKFKEARKQKKKTKWTIDKMTADYVLYVNEKKVVSGYVTTDDESV